ncbi:Spy0128 family protein [uncultured Bifidobacterium sp.]|uniref:Spy0128 family protein n=1 Tax=uncultured Bifidobacterium sp. TaxID=165187 RepID=UPI002594A927|nr:FctA domain-containing protein [uncultured Bifidobacterium sp.]
MLTAGLGTGIALANGSDDSNTTTRQTTGPDNSWQIVSGGYEGNESENKTLSEDGKVRIQKNVMPTDVENEFKVYLSIDKQEDISSFFDGAIFGYDNNNSNVTAPSDGYWDSETKAGGRGSVNGRSIIFDRDDATGNKTECWLEIGVYDQGKLIYTWTNGFYIDELPGDAKTFFIADPSDRADNPNNYKALVIGQSGSHQGTREDPIRLKVDVDWEFYSELFGGVERTAIQLGTVTDPMGKNIDFGNVESCDGECSYENGILTWSPKEKPGIEAVNGWYENVAELVYTIRLDVTADGFNSSGLPESYPSRSLEHQYKYPTNGIDSNNDGIIDIDESTEDKQAELGYTVHHIKTGTDGSSVTDNTYTSVFKSPVVRGLLYDLVADKTDGAKPLAGATFGLFDESGENMVDSKGRVTEDPNSQYKVTTADDGRIAFTGLPWGKYTVKEISAPEGYDKTDEPWTVTVCYTNNPRNLKDSTVDENLDTGNHAMVTKAGSFVNKKSTVSATIKVAKSLGGRTGEPGSVFKFTLEPQNEDTPMPVDESGNRMKSMTETISMNGKMEGEALFTGLPIPAGKEGDYTYIVTENTGDVKGVVYSKAVYMVTVHADKQGNLTYTYTRTTDDAGNEGKPKTEDTALFVNGPTEFAGTLTLTKYLVGRNWQEGDAFTFRIEYTGSNPENSTPVPVPESLSPNGKVQPVDGKENVWDVTFSYSPSCVPATDVIPSNCSLDLGFRTVYPTYKNHHFFYYKVTELSGDMPGMLYSKAEYKLEADVFRVDDPSYGDGTGFNVTMLPIPVRDDEGNSHESSGPSTRAAIAEMRFINTFVPVSALPLTGGGSTARSLLLAGGGVLLVAGAAWLLARRRQA